MEVLYKKDGNKNTMIIKEENINEDDYKLQMIFNNEIKGILPLTLKNIDNKLEIHYDISSMVSLESMYAKRRMVGKEIYSLVKSIKKLSDSMREYLLSINGILFETGLVYLKRQGEKFYFCYFPRIVKDTEGDYMSSLRNFFDSLLEYIDHDDRQAVQIAYGIQQITISDSFTVQDLMDCAEKYINSERNQRYAYEDNISRCKKYSISDRKEMSENSYLEDDTQSFRNIDLDQDNEDIFYKPDRSKKRRGTNKNKVEGSKKCKGTDKNKVEGSKKTLEGFWKSITDTFNFKSKYKYETDLVMEETNYTINDTKIEDEKYSFEELETEDATMLLTSMGPKKNITLKCVIEDEMLEISPNKYPCVLGKSKKSSDFYIESPVVSRVHMRIGEELEGYYVEDLNSTNGTFVNGIQLRPHEKKEINVGDHITMADIDFVVE